MKTINDLADFLYECLDESPEKAAEFLACICIIYGKFTGLNLDDDFEKLFESIKRKFEKKIEQEKIKFPLLQKREITIY